MLYPVVGEKTLRDLVAEAKASEKVFKAKVRTTLRSSYSSYYRQMLPPLLNTLGFKCNNTAYRPVMDALALLAKYADVDGKNRFYDAGDAVPMDGIVRKDWREAVVDDKGKIERIPYELCVLVALMDAIRRREIYVEGGKRWGDPEDGLPGDFEAARTVHHAAIRQPEDPKEFVASLKRRMTAGLDRLSAALADGSAGGVKVTTRKGEPWITVPKLGPLDEPTGLQALKDEAIRRWGVLDLLDVLKNATSRTWRRTSWSMPEACSSRCTTTPARSSTTPDGPATRRPWCGRSTRWPASGRPGTSSPSPPPPGAWPAARPRRRRSWTPWKSARRVRLTRPERTARMHALVVGVGLPGWRHCG
ncbi:hypothetical protein [Streptomyces sp. NPDC051909]|uniref:hypothetical protein n=1 Tax=Streptomyces sp. NPDC051909 TaxID=3154944 RepID=UPI00343598D4